MSQDKTSPACSSVPLAQLVGQLPTCQECGGALRLEWRLMATGPAIVAGVMPKLSATNVPHLVCDGCGFIEAGKRPNADMTKAADGCNGNTCRVTHPTTPKAMKWRQTPDRT